MRTTTTRPTGTGLVSPAPPGSDAATGGGCAGSAVDHRSLTARLLHAIADPTSSYLAFAIDETGTCRVLGLDGDVHVLVPDDEGRYDLAPLGWTAC